VLGFPPADPLYAATLQAYNAVHEPQVRCHYAGCASGVGMAAPLHGEPKRRVEPQSMWRTMLQKLRVCYPVSMAQMTPIHVRVDTDALTRLVQIGKALSPKPLRRSQMVNVAIREYVERHTKGKWWEQANEDERHAKREVK